MQPEHPNGDPARALDALLDRLVAALHGGAGSASTATGSDPEGFATAVVDARGRVQRLELDPRLLRDRDGVAPAIRAAINQAVAAAPEDTSGAERAAELKAIQEQSLEVARAINGSLLSSLEQLKQGG